MPIKPPQATYLQAVTLVVLADNGRMVALAKKDYQASVKLYTISFSTVPRNPDMLHA
jgi:hypothetical protein